MCAGGVYGSEGFLGCMRRISVVGFMQKPKDDVSSSSIIVQAHKKTQCEGLIWKNNVK